MTLYMDRGICTCMIVRQVILVILWKVVNLLKQISFFCNCIYPLIRFSFALTWLYTNRRNIAFKMVPEKVLRMLTNLSPNTHMTAWSYCIVQGNLFFFKVNPISTFVLFNNTCIYYVFACRHLYEYLNL